MFYVQDWLTLRVIKSNANLKLDLNNWDKLVYEIWDKKFIWTYIGYKCNTDIDWKILYKLDWKWLDRFFYLDKKAKDIFNNIKDELKLIFPMLKFITAKMDFTWKILYLYFFGESRVDFREWLSDIRQLVWMNFFLYQVWSRDRIRLHPKSSEMIWDCWQQLCCTKTLCKIDSIDTKTISLQNLQVQWLDKQKWVCWKLKCCLKYEEWTYIEKLWDYPDIWTEIEIDWEKNIVVWINTLSEYIFLKNNDWYIKRISKNELPWNIK